MARYFKVTEIDRDSFIEAVEDEIAIPLDVFEEESE